MEVSPAKTARTREQRAVGAAVVLGVVLALVVKLSLDLYRG